MLNKDQVIEILNKLNKEIEDDEQFINEANNLLYSLINSDILKEFKNILNKRG